MCHFVIEDFSSRFLNWGHPIRPLAAPAAAPRHVRRAVHAGRPPMEPIGAQRPAAYALVIRQYSISYPNVKAGLESFGVIAACLVRFLSWNEPICSGCFVARLHSCKVTGRVPLQRERPKEPKYF